MIVLSLVTNIVTHTYLKPTRLRFDCGQRIIEIKKKPQGKTTSGKWRLSSLIMCIYNPKTYFSTNEEQHLNNHYQKVFNCLRLITQLTFVRRLCLSLRKKPAFPSLGHSCKEIRNASSHLRDGEYWIDLKRNRDVLKVYCDMTTEGGKEWIFNKN